MKYFIYISILFCLACSLNEFDFDATPQQDPIQYDSYKYELYSASVYDNETVKYTYRYTTTEVDCFKWEARFTMPNRYEFIHYLIINGKPVGIDTTVAFSTNTKVMRGNFNSERKDTLVFEEVYFHSPLLYVSPGEKYVLNSDKNQLFLRRDNGDETYIFNYYNQRNQ
jgi:hypothetical protein